MHLLHLRSRAGEEKPINMKKHFQLLMAVIAINLLAAACGPTQAEKEAKEKARLDSIATHQADSVKAVTEARQQLIQDSIAQAEKLRLDSLAHAQSVADSVAKAEAAKKTAKQSSKKK